MIRINGFFAVTLCLGLLLIVLGLQHRETLKDVPVHAKSEYLAVFHNQNAVEIITVNADGEIWIDPELTKEDIVKFMCSLLGINIAGATIK